MDPTASPDPYLNITGVLAHLAANGRTITRGTWTSYVTRGQAPAPDRRHVDKHTGHARPQWRTSTINTWLNQSHRRQRPTRPGTQKDPT